jgi:hypothetical protein
MKYSLIVGTLALMLPALAFSGNTIYVGSASGKNTAFGGYAKKDRSSL